MVRIRGLAGFMDDSVRHSAIRTRAVAHVHLATPNRQVIERDWSRGWRLVSIRNVPGLLASFDLVLLHFLSPTV